MQMNVVLKNKKENTGIYINFTSRVEFSKSPIIKWHKPALNLRLCRFFNELILITYKSR